MRLTLLQELAIDEANYGDFDKGYWDLKKIHAKITKLSHNPELTDAHKKELATPP